MTSNKLRFLALCLLMLGSTEAFCPHECECDDFKLEVSCPTSAKLDLVPNTLNPRILGLSLKGNRIGELDRAFQFYYGQLQVVDFSWNAIHTVPDRCFKAQRKLKG